MKLKLLGGFFVGLGLAYVASCFVTPVEPDKNITSIDPPVLVSKTLPTVSSTKKLVHLVPPASRTIFINGEIGMGQGNGDELVQQVYKMGTSHEPMYIVLNSPGGSVITGAAIITALEAAKGPVYTICNQLCASMAAMIFEYGSVRYMTDRSFVMFHPASGQAQGEIDQMMSRLGSIQRYIARMETYIAAWASITYEDYKSLSSKELWLDSEDAKARHFADELASVDFPEQPQQVNILAIPQNSSGITIAPLISYPRYLWQ